MAWLWLDEKDRKLWNDVKGMLRDLENGRKALKEEVSYSTEIIRLKKRITDLEIQEGKIKEGHEKEDRELRHMIGLEKKRQTFEIDQAKRETTVVVREENLGADKARFSDEMKFQRERFTDEVKYLKDLMGEILERLPNISVERLIGGSKDT